VDLSIFLIIMVSNECLYKSSKYPWRNLALKELLYLVVIGLPAFIYSLELYKSILDLI